MASLYADNVTKVRAGGSGDNYVADGFIKTVEKVWIDTYTVAAAIPSTSSLCIGKIPKGKKLTDVIVYLPVLSAAATTSTVYLDTAATTSVAPWGGALEPAGQSEAIATATISTVRLGQTKAFAEMPEDVELFIMINPATTITAGTIKTIIKYT
ncbi:MAG: hypothetical protein WC332_01635 [Clostridia bacterium]|jgi:hypothetical protein